MRVIEKKIGEKLRIAREKLGLGQEEFADLLQAAGYKISDTMISHYEHNRSKPNSELIQIISELCSVSPNWLLNFNERAISSIG